MLNKLTPCAMWCVQVYVAYTEGVNFKKALAGLLGLEGDASIGACLQRIRQLLDRQVLSTVDEFQISALNLFPPLPPPPFPTFAPPTYIQPFQAVQGTAEVKQILVTSRSS